MIEWLFILLVVGYVIGIVLWTFCQDCAQCGKFYVIRNAFRRIGRERRFAASRFERKGNFAMLYVQYPIFIGSQCPRCQSINEQESWTYQSEWEPFDQTWFEVRDCPMCDAKGKLRVHVDKGFFESDPFRNTAGSAQCGFCHGKSWVLVEKIKSLTIV